MEQVLVQGLHEHVAAADSTSVDAVPRVSLLPTQAALRTSPRATLLATSFAPCAASFKIFYENEDEETEMLVYPCLHFLKKKRQHKQPFSANRVQAPQARNNGTPATTVENAVL